jgi:hypothetical protein
MGLSGVGRTGRSSRVSDDYKSSAEGTLEIVVKWDIATIQIAVHAIAAARTEDAAKQGFAQMEAEIGGFEPAERPLAATFFEAGWVSCVDAITANLSDGMAAPSDARP